jgi:lysophospholipase L1-like esterase
MKLICFGDSWTAGHGVETDRKYKERVSISESEREYYEGGFHPNLVGYKIISDFIYNKIGFQTN